ncbi:hypothetical protein GOBAR_DD04591 [Gossypium barbadense]|nr:hypothetical protein GOBAR_DD04591 [Gossypium barbadense]
MSPTLTTLIVDIKYLGKGDGGDETKVSSPLGGKEPLGEGNNEQGKKGEDDDLKKAGKGGSGVDEVGS